MDKKLIKFDLLCEDILNQKKTGLLTKIFTNQRYLQDDFSQVWQGSGYKRFVEALQNALSKTQMSKDTLLSVKDVSKMIDKKSATYSDLPAGSVSAHPDTIGIRLTYDIFDEYKYPLLKTLIMRNSEQNQSKFGMFNQYIEQLVHNAEFDSTTNKKFKSIKNIKADIKFEIIASPVANQKSQSDFSRENKTVDHLSEQKFECLLFLWFDATQFKKELIDILDDPTNKTRPQSTSGLDDNQVSSNKIDDIIKQKENIEKINFKNSKIKLGSMTMDISGREPGTLSNLWKGLKDQNLTLPIAKMLGNSLGFNKVFGLNKGRSERADRVKVKEGFFSSVFNIGDVSNPFVYVTSKVTLDQWLYTDDFSKSATDTKETSNNMMIQLHKPFKLELLKIDSNSPGKLTTNIDNTKVWTTHQRTNSTSWDENTNMKQYLESSQKEDKQITCRWQYYVDSSRTMYIEYRVAINFTDLYTCLNILYEKVTEFAVKVADLIDNGCDIKLLEAAISQANTNISALLDQNSDLFRFINEYSDSYDSLRHYLRNSTDSRSGMSAKGSHMKNFIFFDKFFNEELVMIQKEKTRNIDYDPIPLNNFFNYWWIKRYSAQNTKGVQPDLAFSLISVKKLYTNNGKNPQNDVSVPARRNLQSFKDADGNSADYFESEVFNKFAELNLNGQTLNTFYTNQIKKFFQDNSNIDLNNLKDYFNKLKKLNNILANKLQDPIVISNKALKTKLFNSVINIH